MNDARFDRPRTGDATGNARPVEESAPNRLDTTDAARTQDWSSHARGRSVSSKLLHWIDEKGAVVRLLTSVDPDKAEDVT